MGKIYLPADHDIALALREPNLLVPGTKPFGQVRPKQLHPFTNGLGCLFCNFSDGDLSPNRHALTLNSGTTIQGANLSASASASGAYVGQTGELSLFPKNTGVNGGFEFTLIYSGVQPVDLANGEYSDIIGYTKAANNFGVELRFYAGIGWKVYVDTFSPLITSATDTIQTGRPFTIVVNSDSSGNFAVYVDGNLIGSATNTNELYPRTSDYFGILERGGDSGGNATGICFLAGFSQTDVGTDEAQRLSLDPYRLIEPANQSPFLISVPAGGSTYTLTAESGTYTFSGSAAALITTKNLSAETGAFTFAGSDATITYNPVTSYSLTAEAGSYSFAGSAAAFTVSRSLLAEAGSYSFSAADAGITYNPVGAYSLTAEAGSFAFTGADATFKVSRALTANQGAYAFEGSTAALTYGRKLTAEAGSYAFAGSDATFSRGVYALTADAASYTFNGSAVTFTYSGQILWTEIDPVTTTWTEI
jgi:hypothetical protein